MNIAKTPNLTEPGVIYFLKETLKRCNEKKLLFYNTVLNLGLLFIFGFLSIFGVLIYTRKRRQ